jgi:hypothetical protein
MVGSFPFVYFIHYVPWGEIVFSPDELSLPISMNLVQETERITVEERNLASKVPTFRAKGARVMGMC